MLGTSGFRLTLIDFNCTNNDSMGTICERCGVDRGDIVQDALDVYMLPPNLLP